MDSKKRALNSALFKLLLSLFSIEYVLQVSLAMLLQAAVKRQRLARGKQSVLGVPGWEAWSSHDWCTVEDENARQHVFLLTLSAVNSTTQSSTDAPLRDVQQLNREQVLESILDAVAHPVSENAHGGRPRSAAVVVVKAFVFMELHADGRKHFHVALKLDGKHRFLPFKNALRQRWQLASHWSTTHTMFWSVCRYGAFATPKKQTVDLSPLPYSHDEESLNLFEEHPALKMSTPGNEACTQTHFQSTNSLPEQRQNNHTNK